MEQILQFDKVSDYDQFHYLENLHPLVSVIDFKETPPMDYGPWMRLGFYAIFLKDAVCGDFRYGRMTYDYQDKTMMFVSPGQVLSIGVTKGYKPQGYALLFHPDLIHGTSLGKRLHEYTFFSYEVREALHLSTKERKIILDCLDKIKYELEQSIDKHSRSLISANIELLLDYCVRFYDRQFITRNDANKGILESFEILLNEYLNSGSAAQQGLPAVSYFADKLNLSPNYFGDLIKKETGQSAKEYIHQKVMSIAKEKIMDTRKTVNEIAGELGFKYPQHFTRAFKKSTGYTPHDYRLLS